MSNTIADIQKKLARIERGLDKVFKTRLPDDESNVFHPNMSDDEIRDIAIHLILDVYHVKDHLKRWFEAEKLDDKKVELAVNASNWLCILADLANKEKHGTPLDRPRSNHDPELTEVTCGLRPNQGKIRMRLVDGKPQIIVDELTPVVFSPSVQDRNGRKLGSLVQICNHAVNDWLRFCEQNGIAV